MIIICCKILYVMILQQISLLVLLSLASCGHLPRAYLPPARGDRAANRGNANSPAAQKELAALASRLLHDPPSPYPWQRTVLNASANGAIPNDGKLDDAGLKSAALFVEA